MIKTQLLRNLIKGAVIESNDFTFWLSGKTHLVRKQGSLWVSGRDANDEHISWATYCGNNGSMVHAPSCCASWWRRRNVGISWRNNHQSRKINKYYNMTTTISLKDSNFKPGIFKDLTFYSSHYSLLFSSVQEPLEMKDKLPSASAPDSAEAMKFAHLQRRLEGKSPGQVRENSEV